MSIKIKSLSIDKLSEKSLKNDFLYKDISLDMNPNYSYNNQLNRKENLKDVQALYDVESVKNSIRNCFLTIPRQKILNPTFGVNLIQYLFEPVDDFTSDIIQRDIEDKLPELEPRITIKNVSVVPDYESNQYNISLEIDIPSLNAYGVSIKTELQSTSYAIV
jgi:phage baseplate assembly protein W